MLQLTIFFFPIILIIESYGDPTVLYSPRVTNWGLWSDWKSCPTGKYVKAMQLKVEQIVATGIFGYSDNTGLNGIELYCAALGESRTRTIMNAGNFGSWGSTMACPTGTFATGFQLRSEAPRGSNVLSWFFGANANDDTAANNLRLFCSKSNSIEGYGTSEGYWSPPQHCLEHQVICGMRTQIEPDQGKGDDTGLNNVDMICCDVPNPAANCTPIDSWDLITECDNTDGVKDINCHYEKKVGVSYASTASKREIEIYKGLGYAAGSVGSTLLSNFGDELGTGNTGYTWSSTTSEISTEETRHAVSFSVPPGHITKLLQVVGTCGIYSVRVQKFSRVDTNIRTHAIFQSEIGPPPSPA